jgi:hypothetical protein
MIMKRRRRMSEWDGRSEGRRRAIKLVVKIVETWTAMIVG